jgi:hypothetical protein
LRRPTKDIDIFCKAGDYPKILNKFTSLGYKTQVLDERWIAKILERYDGADVACSPDPTDCHCGKATMSSHRIAIPLAKTTA